MTLTEDQRWLLWTVGLNISRALLSEEGLQSHMSRRGGYLGSPRDGAPAWMNSYETHGNKITSPMSGGVRVSVTASQIRAFSKTIPAELFSELAAINKAELDEQHRTSMWCRCHWTYDGEPRAHTDFMGREHYHPTEDEDEAHMDIVFTLRDREWDCLAAILGVDSEPVGQLELFEVSGC
ncbi:hypothetical protein [Mycobacteroides abscessus]|uniref:hypothetical protein n=1 Tax=Mycobacteroides abscessus TaxID=36809 RepID=UPI000E6876BD|nr:hypothetical protein [Mycobacteroides abscessus]RIT69239.1 hypothetical protein D2E87_01420 [Mycobacteroides abscessus]